MTMRPTKEWQALPIEARWLIQQLETVARYVIATSPGIDKVYHQIAVAVLLDLAKFRDGIE